LAVDFTFFITFWLALCLCIPPHSMNAMSLWSDIETQTVVLYYWLRSMDSPKLYCIYNVCRSTKMLNVSSVIAPNIVCRLCSVCFTV